MDICNSVNPEKKYIYKLAKNICDYNNQTTKLCQQCSTTLPWIESDQS